MLRLFGFLVLALAGVGGILFLDFNRTVREADAADAPPPSFRIYLRQVPEKLVSLTGSSQSSAPILPLADMLPRAPEGWTMRPIEKTDIEGFLPKARGEGDPAMIDRVQAVGSARAAKGAEVVIQAYEKGERRVVFQVVRHPDSIFTGLDAIDRRYELQMQAAEPRGRAFLTVRGLDVTEEFLGDGMRARYFSAGVGAQIEIRVLASKRLKDADLLPFFTTLNVAAMNAAVIDREPGLGELPVIALASAMTEADRAAFEADRAARAVGAVLRAAKARDDARAALADLAGDAATAAPVAPKPGLGSDCQKDAGGTKRCSVTPDG